MSAAATRRRAPNCLLAREASHAPVEDEVDDDNDAGQSSSIQQPLASAIGSLQTLAQRLTDAGDDEGSQAVDDMLDKLQAMQGDQDDDAGTEATVDDWKSQDDVAAGLGKLEPGPSSKESSRHREAYSLVEQSPARRARSAARRTAPQCLV